MSPPPAPWPASFAIIGTGAVGGYYGALLARSGCEVHFLLRSDYQHVRRHGLSIQSPRGSFDLPRVNACDRVDDMPPVDVVVLATKSTANSQLPNLLPPLLAGDAVVLVLQNGLGVDEAVAAVAGPQRVLAGLCFLCSQKVGPGRIHHLDYGQIALAEYHPDRPGGITPRLAHLGAAMERAGISIELHPDLRLARWKKLMWNIPFSGLSVVLNTTTDRIMANPHSRALALDIMKQVITAAGACGQHIPGSFADHMMDLTDRMPPYRSSTKIDFDEGRPMEVEAIFGEPVRIARAAGHEPVLLDFLYRQIKFLDAHRARA